MYLMYYIHLYYSLNIFKYIHYISMRPISSKTETLHGVRLRVPQLIKEQNILERGNNNIVIYYIIYIYIHIWRFPKSWG